MKPSIRFIWMPAALVLALSISVTAEAQSPPSVFESVESRRSRYADIAQQIWEFAEVGYQEVRSSQILESELESAGFDVESGVAGMPTAFVASYGEGTRPGAFNERFTIA